MNRSDVNGLRFARQSAPPNRRHTILFLSSTLSGIDQRALDREARSIQKELEQCFYRDCFEFKTRWAAEPLDLLREFRKLRPTVVQLNGHGDPNGLSFQATDGHAQLVSAEALGDAFSAAGASVKLVVLSACYGKAQVEMLLRYVDCVVWMDGPIHPDSARCFATGFYGGLGEFEPIEAAFKQGRAAIRLEGLPDSDRPQFKVRDRLDAGKLVLIDD